MSTKKAIQREQDKQRKHRLNVFLIITGILVALGVGGGQLWYAHKAGASTRPDISLLPIIPQPFASHEHLVVIAQFRNSGSAEARDVMANSTLLSDRFKTEQEAADAVSLYNSHQSDGRATLAPSEVLEQILTSPHELSQEEYQSVMNGTQKVYLFSRISYTDIFAKKYGRDTCQYFDPHVSRMALCKTHNSSF